MGSPSPGRLLVVALITVVSCLAVAPASDAAATRYSSAELRVVSLINQARARHLAPPLRLNAKLERAARAHSHDMLARDYFGHGDMSGRLRRYGVRGLIGENLAWSSESLSPGQIVRMWMTSAPHRGVLLLRGFHRIGLGMPVGPFQGYGRAVVVTADFSG